MPDFQFYDRVRETSKTTGTGAFALLGAVADFQSFAIIGDGIKTYYFVYDGVNWEVGKGTYSAAGPSLSRDTVLASSNGGSLVNFPPGTKNIAQDPPAAWFNGVMGRGALTPSVSLTLPPAVVLGQPAIFAVAVTGSGPTPTGTVTFLDGAAVVANGLLANGTAVFALTAALPGSHSFTAVYSGDSTYAAATSAASVVQAVAPSFSDTFARPGGAAASLGPNWTVYGNSFGSPASDTWAVSGNQAQASALAAGGTQGIAVPTGVTFADMTVQADMTLGAVLSSSYGAVGVRQAAASDSIYVALVQQSSTLRFVELGIKVAAIASALPGHSSIFISEAPGDLYTIRLMVLGTQLFLFVNGALLDAGSNASLSAPGNGGIVDKGGVAEFANFSLTAGLAFTDTFLRKTAPPLTSLTPGYSEDVGSGFAINASNQATPASGYSSGLCVASLSGLSFSQCDANVVIASYGSGAAGLVVQWDAINFNGYAVVLGSSAVTVENVVGGAISSTLATYAVTPAGSNTLEVQAVGSTLNIFLNGAFVATYTDLSGLYACGTVGIIADNTSALCTSFSLNVCRPQEG